MTIAEFNHHYQQNQSMLTNFAYKLTKNLDDAKDLVQEAALKAFKYIDSFRQGTNFRAWICTILRNTFITNFNRKRNRPVVNTSLDEFLFAIDAKNHIGNQAESALRIQRIVRAIDRLKDKYSGPFWMHYKGYSYEEIAEQLNVPIGTIKSRIFTARKKLQKQLINQK